MWGNVIKLSDVKGGDVLQFRNHKIKVVTVKVTRRTQPGGRWHEDQETATETQERAHHTSVVSSNDGGGRLTVIEQNVNDPETGEHSKVVQQSTLYVQNIKPQKNKVTRQDGDVTVDETTTVTVTVSGKVHAYRPHPK